MYETIMHCPTSKKVETGDAESDAVISTVICKAVVQASDVRKVKEKGSEKVENAMNI